MIRSARYHAYLDVNSAESDWMDGSYASALSILDRLPDDRRAVTLRAKILSRTGNPRKALEAIEDYSARNGYSPLLCAVAATAAAQASTLEDVDVWVSRVGDIGTLPSGARGEAAFYICQAHWISRRYDLAEKVLPLALGDCSANGALRARILYGLMLGVRKRHEEQVGVLRFAVQRALGERGVESHLIANAASSLFVTAWETGACSSTDSLHALYDQISWPDASLAPHFRSLRALGWRRALDGAFTSAYRFFRRASLHAPSHVYVVIAQLDLVSAMRRADEAIAAEVFLREALDAAARIKPADVAGDERNVFLYLCELDPAQAPRWMSLFEESSRRDHRDSGEHDQRFSAMEDYARSFVYRAEGNAAKAIWSLRSARDVFLALGFRWRAVLAEQALHELSAPVSTPTKVRDFSSLTVREREVLDLICEGLSAAKIAERLFIARRTAENHTSRLLTKMGVHSRYQLARLCEEDMISARRARRDELSMNTRTQGFVGAI